MFLARHHAALSSRFRMTVPPWDLLRWAYDKRLTYRLAGDIGVDHPKTFYPATRDELSNLDCSFPVILKPAFKKQVNRFTRDKAWRADDRQTLAARYAEACELVGPDVVMVQELIAGGGEAQFSYAALCADGRTLASVTARRTRQYPVEFGRSSSMVETCDQPAIEEPARRLLSAMRYTGLVEVEFKYDRTDRRYKLLDVNPRVWTWQALCGRAGVDFPYLLWRSIHGDPVPELRARPGVRWVRMSTDLAAASTEMLRGRLSLRAYLRSLKRSSRVCGIRRRRSDARPAASPSEGLFALEALIRVPHAGEGEHSCRAFIAPFLGARAIERGEWTNEASWRRSIRWKGVTWPSSVPVRTACPQRPISSN